MAELVRDDVRLREVARRPEALGQLVEESEIEVDLVIARDSRRGRSRPARSRRPN